MFDERNSYCDFSYKRKCIYVNEVNNTVGWIQETIISKHYLQQNNSEIALAPEDTLSPSAYEPPLVTNKTIRSKLLSVRLAEDRSEAGGNTSMHESLYFAKETLTRRKRSQTRSSASGCVNKICPSHTSQTKSTKKITSRRKSTVLAVRRAVSSETFEVGPFRRSAAAYVKFKFSASGGFAYCFYVVAHCLPDPPGHLDHVGSVTDPAVTYKLERHSSSGSHTVCLNLRDTVECEKFAIRFTAYVAHLSGDTARLTFTPKGVHRNPIVGNCPGETGEMHAHAQNCQICLLNKVEAVLEHNLRILG